MFPDFSYFLHYVFDIPPDNFFSIIKTFGLFLALAFLASAYILYIELKRKEKEGLLKKITVHPRKKNLWRGVIIQSLIGFFLGFKVFYAIQNSQAFSEDPAGILLSPDGSLIGGFLGIILLGGYYYFRNWNSSPQETKPYKLHPYEKVSDITIVAAISGILGAKLFAIFESAETIRAFLESPLQTLISGSGLAIYGGLIVAAIVLVYYVRKMGLNPYHMTDAVAPALILGYAVGRLGCHFSGDGDWGEDASPQPDWWFLPDWLWAYDYPHNVLKRGELMEGCTYDYCYVLSEPVYPTPIYEVVMSLIIFLILWSVRKKIDVAGRLFALYLILNGIERYFIEKIRINDTFFFMGMEVTQAEVISVLFIITGIAAWILLPKYAPKK